MSQTERFLSPPPLLSRLPEAVGSETQNGAGRLPAAGTVRVSPSNTGDRGFAEPRSGPWTTNSAPSESADAPPARRGYRRSPSAPVSAAGGHEPPDSRSGPTQRVGMHGCGAAGCAAAFHSYTRPVVRCDHRGPSGHPGRNPNRPSRYPDRGCRRPSSHRPPRPGRRSWWSCSRYPSPPWTSPW